MKKQVQTALLSMIMLLVLGWFTVLFLSSSLSDRDLSILLMVVIAVILAPAAWLSGAALAQLIKRAR